MAAKMKALLKGLRYISQKIENEKDPNIVIGAPTDVKHVAHVGWDGPSVDSPSWMNDYKPPSANGGQDSRESASDEASKPKKRESITSTSTSANESPTKTEKHRSRRASRTSLGGKDVPEATSELVDQESPRKKQHPDHAPAKRPTTKKKKPRDGTGPPRSASRLSAPKATAQHASSPADDSKERSENASLRDEEMCDENRRGQGNDMVS